MGNKRLNSTRIGPGLYEIGSGFGKIGSGLGKIGSVVMKFGPYSQVRSDFDPDI